MTLYLLSGLGADKRIFQKLRIDEKYSIVHIDWLTPEKNEPINAYVLRLASAIDQAEPFTIIGLSFGGIIATELSKIVSPVQTIIISSISSDDQLPWLLSVIKHLKLYKLIPSHFIRLKSRVVYWFMGAKTMREKAVFNQILKNTDIDFFRWAVSAILRWEQPVAVKNMYHIHGSSDAIFPIANIACNHIIQKGGHLMVYSRAEEISLILNKQLEL